MNGERFSNLPFSIDTSLHYADSPLEFSTSPTADGSLYGTESTFSETTTLLKCNVDETVYMADRIYTIAIDMGWLNARDKWSTSAAVVVRSGEITALSPYGDLSSTSSIEDLAIYLRAQAVFAMTSIIVSQLIDTIPPTSRHFRLKSGRKVAIYDSLTDAFEHRKTAKHGYFLVRNERMALLWTNSAKNLVKEAKACDKALTFILQAGYGSEDDTDEDEKMKVVESKSEPSPMLEAQTPEMRKMSLIWPATIALTFVLLGLMVGKLSASMLLAVLRDENYYHLFFLLYLPLACALSAFFLSIIVVGLFQLCGPIFQVTSNSSTYSGQRIKSNLLPHDLPHITIQCPVYKESLWDVLVPTFESVREAITTYELQGGTASIIVNDDGIRLLNPEDAAARLSYYQQNFIGWTARPEHNLNGYVRSGAFKKASNLNFGMRASLAVEKEFDRLAKTSGRSAMIYSQAMESVVLTSKGDLLAGGDIGLGDLILLIDADTRIPRDCFIDAAKEFHESPSLALLQHPSGVLQVSHDFWEDGLAHFTKNNYLGTKYVVAGGDSTPFFGHNAFLKVSAIFDTSVTIDGVTRWWSEEHVSEDFEMSLKLLSIGHTSRMAGYSNGDFKEGVCLTVYDEINRWEKYAYGVCELMFNPVHKWLLLGPITPLAREFLASNMDPAAKCSSIFYMWTYFAIGVSWPMCVFNYFLIGWLPLLVRSYYVDTLQILVSVTVIFSLKDASIGPLVMYRLGEARLGRGLWDAIRYFFIVSIFLQGISIHVSKCLIWHLCGIKMHWGATNKSVENHATMREDLPLIWRRFKFMYIFIFTLFIMVIMLGCAVPARWRIIDLKAILPLLWILFWHAAVPLLMHNRSFLSDLYRKRSSTT